MLETHAIDDWVRDDIFACRAARLKHRLSTSRVQAILLVLRYVPGYLQKHGDSHNDLLGLFLRSVA